MDSVSMLGILVGIAALCITCFAIGFTLGQAMKK
jgi:hypothetical protein